MAEDRSWHLKDGGFELHAICDLAINEACSGKDLAHVATLIVGARLIGSFGEKLRARIHECVVAIHATGDPQLALKHAKGIGEALYLLNEGSPVALGLHRVGER